jgi:hypothetical protein
MSASEATAKYGVSAVSARKWLSRYLADGAAGLLDRSSRPEKSPRAIEPHVALAIVELRRKRYLQARIATHVCVFKATVSRVLRRAGLSDGVTSARTSPCSATSATAPASCCTSTSKLGRFDKIGHHIAGDRTQRARRIGRDYVFVAADDHSRIAFTQIHPDETMRSAQAFLRAAVGHFDRLGVPIQRVLTDNGMSFRSGQFAPAYLSNTDQRQG